MAHTLIVSEKDNNEREVMFVVSLRRTANDDLHSCDVRFSKDTHQLEVFHAETRKNHGNDIEKAMCYFVISLPHLPGVGSDYNNHCIWDLQEELETAIKPYLDPEIIELVDGEYQNAKYLFFKRHPRLVETIRVIPAVSALFPPASRYYNDEVAELATGDGVSLKEAFCMLWNDYILHGRSYNHGSFQITTKDLSSGLMEILKNVPVPIVSQWPEILDELFIAQENGMVIDPNGVQNTCQLGLEEFISVCVRERAVELVPAVMRNPLATERTLQRYIKRNHWEDKEDMNVFTAMPSLLVEIKDTLMNLDLDPALFSFARIVELSHEYHDKIQREENQKALQEYSEPDSNLFFPPAIIPPYEDEYYRIEPIMDALSLVKEGISMRHCAAKYVRQCEAGNSFICHVSSISGDEHATLEVGSGFNIRQLLGVKNAPASGDMKDWVNKVVVKFLGRTLKVNAGLG